MAQDDPLDLVRKLTETYRGVKFGRGVVGKTSYATIALIGLWTVIVFRLSTGLAMNIALFSAGLIATGIYIWWVRGTQKFAEKNPGLAILEGAELIEYQKWEAGVKGIEGPLKGDVIPDSSRSKLEDLKE